MWVCYATKQIASNRFTFINILRVLLFFKNAIDNCPLIHYMVNLFFLVFYRLFCVVDIVSYFLQ